MRFLLAAVTLLATLTIAQGHGPAQWIQDGFFRNAMGEFCCGELDCCELTDPDVGITAAGYLVKSLNETVPYQEAQPSPDGHYWRCASAGKRKCFFAPPTAS